MNNRLNNKPWFSPNGENIRSEPTERQIGIQKNNNNKIMDSQPNFTMSNHSIPTTQLLITNPDKKSHNIAVEINNRSKTTKPTDHCTNQQV